MFLCLSPPFSVSLSLSIRPLYLFHFFFSNFRIKWNLEIRKGFSLHEVCCCEYSFVTNTPYCAKCSFRHLRLLNAGCEHVFSLASSKHVRNFRVGCVMWSVPLARRSLYHAYVITVAVWLQPVTSPGIRNGRSVVKCSHSLCVCTSVASFNLRRRSSYK
jgi:hypothetical protein